MRESEEAARLDIATDSLSRFIHSNEPVTRNMFFVSCSPKDSELHNQAFRAKGWQKSFIQRLVDYCFLRQVKEEHTVMYELYSDAAYFLLALVIIDRDSYHGILISRLVFGGMTEDGFIELCVRRYHEMKDEGFTSISNDTTREYMSTKFPDLRIFMKLESAAEEANSKTPEELSSLGADRMQLAGRYEGSIGSPEVDQMIEVAEQHVAEAHEDEEDEAENDEDRLAPNLPKTLDMWGSLLRSAQEQNKGLGIVRDLLVNLLKQQDTAADENASFRATLRDGNKEVDQLVKSLQGVLRQHGSLAQTDILLRLKTMEESSISSAKSLELISSTLEALHTSVEYLTHNQKLLFEQLQAAQNDKLGRAAQTLEAASELLTEALAERQS